MAANGALPATPHVLVIPYPAQGHMLPLLDLAHQLSLRGLAITIVVTPKNLPILTPLLSRSPSVNPLVLPFPSYPSLPPGVENARDMPGGVLPFRVLINATAGLHPPLLRWARSNPISAILSDFFLGWTLGLAHDLSVPRLVFSPSGALAIAVGHSLWRHMPPPADSHTFADIPGSPAYPWYQLSPLFRTYAKDDPTSEFVRDCFLANMNSWGFVFNTFEELEKPYLDHVRKDLGHERVWAVGPLQPVGGPAGRGGPAAVPADDLMAWLDGCEEGSVVYVCFGSQAQLTPRAAATLAAGLERSGARFVWAVRAGAELPEGFEERVRGRGLVVKGWAPQVAVLGHAAVGSFVTHCGWNSVLEGIAAGVALLTWPMGADQYTNARLLAEAGIGVKVWEGPAAGEEVPDPEEIARVVGETVRGERPERERAREMRRRAEAAVGEGGSSFRDLEGLVEVIKKLNLSQIQSS